MRILLILIAAALLLAGGTAFFLPEDRGEPRYPDYLSCASERIMTYGAGKLSKPLAEMAAMVRWNEEAKTLGVGYDNWALAQERWIICRKVDDTEYLQCRIAGLPCRPKHAAANAYAPADMTLY